MEASGQFVPSDSLCMLNGVQVKWCYVQTCVQSWKSILHLLGELPVYSKRAKVLYLSCLIIVQMHFRLWVWFCQIEYVPWMCTLWLHLTLIKQNSSFEELTHTTPAMRHHLVGHSEVTLLPEEFSQELYAPTSTYIYFTGHCLVMWLSFFEGAWEM